MMTLKIKEMKSEIYFMQRAIDLSKLGKYNVAPNPMVGCVITEKNKIIRKDIILSLVQIMQK